jgi:hypothetical protein
MSRNVDLGSPLQLTARTGEVESRNRAEVFCIVSFSIRCHPRWGPRAGAGMGLRRPSNLASTVEMMRLKSERRSHLGAPPPIAQAATVFEE